MRRSKRILAVMLPLFFVGVGSLVHYTQNLFRVSEKVRIVDIIGLSAAGAMCRAALTGVMVAVLSRNQAPVDQSMVGKQSPPRLEQVACVA